MNLSKLKIKPIFSNIKDGDYFEPVKKMKEIFSKSIYLDKILNKNKINDFIILQYILCKNDIRLIISQDKESIRNMFKQKINPLCYKKLEITKKDCEI